MIYGAFMDPTMKIRNSDLDVTIKKKSFSDHSIRACSLTLWNSLPAEIKNSRYINHF